MSNPRARRVKIAAIASGATVISVCAIVELLLTGHFTGMWPRPGSDEVVGVMLLDSDAGGSVRTESHGAILAIPSNDVAEFWRLAGQQAPRELERTAFTVRPGDLKAARGVAGGIGLFGRFTLRPMASRPYLVCHANDVSADGAYRVLGCAEIQLTTPGRIEATYGDRGFGVAAND